MRYFVTFAVNARYTADVEAENYAEAIKIAEDKWCDADIGELDTVDSWPCGVEDDKGNYIWEK